MTMQTPRTSQEHAVFTTLRRAAVALIVLLTLLGGGAVTAQAATGQSEEVLELVGTVEILPETPPQLEVLGTSVFCTGKFQAGPLPTMWMTCYNIGGPATGYSLTVYCSDGKSYNSGRTGFGWPAVASCGGGAVMTSVSVWAHY